MWQECGHEANHWPSGSHTQDRKTTPWLWLSVVTMVGGCCVVVLVLVVNHTLWLCLCGGVGCGDHEWWHLALHQASHASAHCVALLLWWRPLVLLCHHQSLLPSCCWLKEWWWHLMRPVWGLMAHGWVYEGMGLVSGRKETGLAVWCFVLSGSSTLCVVPPFWHSSSTLLAHQPLQPTTT